MLLSSFDFGIAKSIKSVDEIHFKKNMSEKYGISVIESLYVKGKIEDNIILWISFDKCSTQAKVCVLKQIIDAHSVGVCLNSDEFPSEVCQFAQEIISCFLKCFNEAEKTNKITRLYVYDFFKAVKNYAYGNASAEIKILLEREYQIDKTSIFIFYEPTITIVCKSEQQYSSYKIIKSDIVESCFNIIKKFDHYGVLTTNDIAVNIVKESELSKITLNDYRMKQ